MVSTSGAVETAEALGRWTDHLESRVRWKVQARCAPWGALWYPCCKQEELRRSSWVTGISGG